MTIKRFRIDKELKKKLLEEIEKEEKELLEKAGDASELRREEHILEGQIKDLIGTEGSEVDFDDKHRDELFLKIKEHLSDPIKPEKEPSDAKVTRRSSNRRRLIYGLVAAGIAGVYVMQTRGPATLSDNIISKGGMQSGSDLSCEIVTLGSSSGELSGDGSQFFLSAAENLEIQLFCNGPAWVHLAVKEESKKIVWYSNLRVDNQDNFIKNRKQATWQISINEPTQIGVYLSETAVTQPITENKIEDISKFFEVPVNWQDTFYLEISTEPGEP